MIQFNRYPGGKNNVLTMSYDDGHICDRRLIEIFNQYDIRGSFHLPTHIFNEEFTEHVKPDEVKELYSSHEISCHGFWHPSLTIAPASLQVDSILTDRRNLERLCDYPVRGMSWPNGHFNSETISAAKACGIVYSRTAISSKNFARPESFLVWNPTCHHSNCLDMLNLFFKQRSNYRSNVFYVWGHSSEFERDKNWNIIEEFCRQVSGLEDVWYATSIEIYDYINAQNQLQFTADMDKVYNPSVMSVWINADNETVEIPGGKTVALK